jgi:hypothetical protein
MRKLPSLATALIVLALLFAVVSLLPQPAQAHPDPWWDANWQYRMLINITENSGSTLTNYQVPITINTTTFNYSKANASGNDIRFATDGTQCDYWIETWNSSGQSKLWVEVPSLPASSTTTIYMYYGNSGASAASNFNNTFTKDYGESGLAALWHMDEGSGTTTADSSGNGNAGSLKGNLSWVGSDGGQWDGRSDVNFSTGNSLSFGGPPKVEGRSTGIQGSDSSTHPITMPSGIVAGELLIIVFSVDGNPTCTADGGFTKLGQTSYSTTVTGAIFYKIAVGGDTCTVNTSTSQQSSHVVLRISGADTPTGTSSNSDGSNSNPPSHTALTLKDHLWLATRSGDGTVVATAAPTNYDNLQSQAGGSSGAGTNTAERLLYAASEDPGTFTSGSEQWVCYTIAIPSISYVQVSDSPSLNTPSAITIEAWVKPTWAAYPDWDMVYIDWDVTGGTNNSVHFSLYNGKVSLYISSTGANADNLDGNTTLTLNQWSYIAATFNAGTFNVYLNGQTDATQKVSGTVTSIFNSTYAKTIGVKNNAAHEKPFKGPIDEVRIYNRALSANEIKCHYERRKYASTEPTVNLGQEESSAPTVGTITISPSSMTPQEQWTNITVPVTDNATLADVNKVNVTVFYDAAGSNPSAPETTNVSTCAILTWTRGGSPWAIDQGTGITWAINTAGCSNASDTLTTGNWVFSFKVGKVATHSPGSDNWDIYAKATDSISQTGDNYLRDVEMNWYGEITVGTSTVSWGIVSPGCSNNISPVVNITYICNSNYSEQVKTSQNWTSASGNVTLNTTGSPGAGEFSLKADDDDTIADAVQVLSASYTTFDTGTQTTESGNLENNNHLWLSLGLGIPVDTYSGTIYLGIIAQ